MSKKTLLFGGSRGIGYEIFKNLSLRGDEITKFSRFKNKNKNNIKFEIGRDNANDLKKLINFNFNYLIFSHRYRGNNDIEEYKIMVTEIEKIIDIFLGKFKKEASIVIIGSNASKYILSEQPGSYHYVRGAIDTMVKYLAVKYGKHSIRVNSVLPCTIFKKENIKFFKKEKKTINIVENITPLNRMGNSKDISNTIEFLCSEKSSFITGQSIYVDGGSSLIGQESVAKLFFDKSKNVKKKK